MRLIINGYEVEIKAKKNYLKHERFNKDDTMCFLNELSILSGEASEAYRIRKREYLSEWAENARNNIFNYLEKKGYYNEQ